MFNLNKTIKYYILTDKDAQGKIYTITTNKDDCLLYVHELLKMIHIEHYSKWCDLRDYKCEDVNAWTEYFNNCISYEEKSKYIVRKIGYTREGIASIIRMFVGCVPLGCSFETDQEHAYFNEKMIHLTEALSVSEE